MFIIWSKQRQVYKQHLKFNKFDVVTNNNDIKSRVIEAINIYFNLDNWEFGESFYFSEFLNLYNESMTPDIVSIVAQNEQSLHLVVYMK